MLFRLFKNMLHAMIRKPRVISRDGLTLTDPALGLVGQPDRIEQLSNGQFILVESHFGVRPDFGWAPISVRPSLQQCQGCGFRTQCSQARSS